MKPFDANGGFRPSADDDGMLRLRAARSVGVSILSQVLGFAMQVMAMVVLARLLRPADFGLVAIVTTFSLLLMNAGLNGITEAVVQRKEIDHALVSNMFWVGAGTGIVLTTAFAAAAPLLGRFYGDARTGAVAIGMSLTILITSVSIQHLALLKRSMRFSALSANDVIARAASVAVSVILAWAGWGYWALVAGAIAMQLATCIGAWVWCRWLPGLPRRVPGTGQMIKFAINVYAHFALNYFTRNVDNLIVGWSFGPFALGSYKKAYDLAVLPLSQLSAPLDAVAVPTLSRLTGDMGRYAHYVLRCLSTLAFVGMGLGAVLALVGKDLILVLLGPGWDEAGRIFTFFGPGIGIMMLYYAHGWISVSIGKPGRWLRWGVVESLVTAVMFLIGRRWGPVGVAAGLAVSCWALTIPALWYAGRPAGLGIGSLTGAIWKYVVAAVLAGVAAAAVVARLPQLAMASGWMAAVSRIVIVAGLFGLLYLGGVILLHRGCAPLYDVARLLRDMLPLHRFSKKPASAGTALDPTRAVGT